MSTIAQLKELERDLFKTLFVDGLIDLALGVWLILCSVLVAWDHPSWGGVAMVFMIPPWQWARTLITEPRIGAVRFRPSSTRARVGWWMGSLSLVTLVGVALVLTRGSLPREIEVSIAAARHTLLGGTLAFLLASLAAIFGIARLLAYGVLVVFVFWFGPALGLPFPLSMSAAGGVVVLSGLVILTRFLRTHPVSAETRDDH